MHDNLALPSDGPSRSSRWLTWCAWLTVTAVCPLVFLGALVTTMKVGMADSRPFVPPHQVIPELLQGEQGSGWKIEHSHRLAGWFAGLCSIVLAVVCWFSRAKRGYRWLGVLALALISLQGILGYARVAYHSWWGPNLAWIHGCFAQVVFAMLVGLAVLMSDWWRVQPALGAGGHAMRIWSASCLLLLFVQLVLGGVIRHQPSLLMARLHFLAAFLVVVALLRLAVMALREPGVFGWSPWLMLGFLTLQVLLGVETGINWMARYFNSALASQEPFGLLLMRTSHYFVGSLLFASTAVLALQAFKKAVPAMGDSKRGVLVPASALTGLGSPGLWPQGGPA